MVINLSNQTQVHLDHYLCQPLLLANNASCTLSRPTGRRAHCKDGESQRSLKDLKSDSQDLDNFGTLQGDDNDYWMHLLFAFAELNSFKRAQHLIGREKVQYSATSISSWHDVRTVVSSDAILIAFFEPRHVVVISSHHSAVLETGRTDLRARTSGRCCLLSSPSQLSVATAPSAVSL